VDYSHDFFDLKVFTESRIYLYLSMMPKYFGRCTLSTESLLFFEVALGAGNASCSIFDQVSVKERFVEGLMQINNFSDRSF
jgi:hypothetical protein